MMHLVVISLFVTIFVRDALAIEASTPPLLRSLGPAWASAASVGAVAAIALAAHLRVWRIGRLLDRTGSPRLVARADGIVALSRLGLAAAHAFAVLALGWLDVIRGIVGDLVLVDELLAVSPALAALIAGWWTLYPIDRRVREAMLLRDIDAGRAVHPIPSRRQFVTMGARHHVALVGVPIALIAAWGEAVTLGAERYFERAPPSQAALAALAALQLAGAVAALGIIPPVMAMIWSTSPLSEGELRSRLLSLCRRYRVRVRNLLVWRTGGTMVNGAVMGIFPPLRYVLLTDSLLESLTEREVEAVMAHEVGHIRLRHMLWLAAALAASLLWAGAAAQWIVEGVLGERGVWAEASATAVALVAAAVAFGFVSRRFEWQADAFAAAHLSRPRTAQGAGDAALPAPGSLSGATPPVEITAEAVAAMSSALERVATLNHIPPERFGWRHGTIASRWRRLAGLVGERSDRLPIDRRVRRMKWLSAAALALIVGLAVWSAIQ